MSDRPGGPGEDPEVAELTTEIAQTRSEMTRTVETIGDRLDPAHIARDARRSVRGATVGKVENMANTAGGMVNDAGTTVQQAGSGIAETIRRNPLPAAMAAIGIGWLWMNRMSGQTGGMSSGMGGPGYAESPAERIGRSASGAADRVGQTAGQTADTIGRSADQAMSQARSTAEQVPDQVGARAGQVGDQASRMLEENPLAAGAVAVAVGAAVGMALPTTRTEHQVMGPASGRAISQAESAVTDRLKQAESTASEQRTR